MCFSLALEIIIPTDAHGDGRLARRGDEVQISQGLVMVPAWLRHTFPSVLIHWRFGPAVCDGDYSRESLCRFMRRLLQLRRHRGSAELRLRTVLNTASNTNRIWWISAFSIIRRKWVADGAVYASSLTMIHDP